MILHPHHNMTAMSRNPLSLHPFSDLRHTTKRMCLFNDESIENKQLHTDKNEVTCIWC